MFHRQVTNILFLNHNGTFLINCKSVIFLCFIYQKWFCLPLGTHNLAIVFQFRRFVNQGWLFFLLGFTTSLSVCLSSENSFIKGAFLFFIVCITTSLSLWLSSDDSLMSRFISLSEHDFLMDTSSLIRHRFDVEIPRGKFVEITSILKGESTWKL